jgi:DNA-binding transcriptional MerR regulator
MIPGVKDLLPIGRFSQATRLSPKALRLYDEQGLLRPALVDAATGYRYYALSQARDADRIRLLRSLELPLDEIRRYLGAPDADARQAVLRAHAARVESRVAAEREILARLDRLARGEESGERHEVALEQVPARQIVAVRLRTPLSALAARAAETFGALFRHVATSRARPDGPPLSLYHGPEFDEDDMDVEMCVPVDRPLSGAGPIGGRELPAAMVAATLHEGPFEELGAAYAALHRFLAERGHETAGPAREIYVVGPGQVTDPAHYRTEVQWPVR